MLNLYGIYKSGMVLQRNKKIQIAGTASSQEEVTCVIKDGDEVLRTTQAKADAFGRFLLIVDSLKSGGPYTMEISNSVPSEAIILEDIYLGEVWLAGGQDNMRMPLKWSSNPDEAANMIKGNKRLHYYVVPESDTIDAKQRVAEMNSKWINIDEKSAMEMSAAAYYYALELMKKVRCHVGIVLCAHDGTTVSCWQSVDSLENSVGGRAYINEWEELLVGADENSYDEEKKEHDQAVEAWDKAYEELLLRVPGADIDYVTDKIGTRPWNPPIGKKSFLRPGGLYETMVLRVMPYKFAGVIFYQGESDCENHSKDYFDAFLSLVNEWRLLQDDTKMPFIYCQLHMYIDKERKFIGFEDYKWPFVRESQYRVYKATRDTYMAILSDCGEFNNINPADKRTPGTRMAFLALKNVYAFKDISATAPYVIDVRPTGGGAEISFAGDFGMLLIKGYGDNGFEICGEDGKFYPCEASVDFDGKTVSCFSPHVVEPITVRYAFFSYGNASLSSDTGLAVLPFTRNLVRNLNDLY